MLVSYQWLSEYLDLSAVSPKELANQLSLTGIEVESVHTPAEGLKNIVVGTVLSCVPHPNSDHLSICQVDVGEHAPIQIICGAPNVKAGIKVIVALHGARIAGNHKIKKGKIRGEVSNGMICSLQELGYADAVIPKAYAEGIYYLPETAQNGASVFPYLLMNDTILELAITPNRADALSMRGVAYEVGAIDRQVPTFQPEKLTEDDNDRVANYLTATVTDVKAAPAYQIRIVKNVQVKESPQWLQNRLMNAGIRPINNVVDVTNYILLLFGQPLHAFDYQQLASKEIVVRQSRAGEQLVTLDGETRLLNADNLVITNGKEPVALAGVMGGKDSEITEATTTVALESAIFDPALIRQTVKEFQLRSEASTRFEKGINPATVDAACDAAAAMIASLADGQVVSGKSIASEWTAPVVVVPLRLERLNQYLGTSLQADEVDEIWAALGFAYTYQAGTYEVTIPPRRWDIHIEADLIEEVARIYGYDRLPSTLVKGTTASGQLSETQQLTRRLKDLLEGCGLTEAISYALTTQEKAEQFVFEKASTAIALQWPMSGERTHLRKNLISGLLDDVAYNLARKNTNVALYEIGKVFHQTDAHTELPEEQTHIAFALTGNSQSKDWQTADTPVDFYTAKGILTSCFAALGIAEAVTYTATQQIPDLHPGRTALLQYAGQTIGWLGQVHPLLAEQYALTPTYVAEINLAALVTATQQPIVYQPISKYPEVARDIALLVDEQIPNQALVTCIQTHGTALLKDIHLFDVYQGEGIAAGKKSMAYRLLFADANATLVDEVITERMQRIEQALRAEFSAHIR